MNFFKCNIFKCDVVKSCGFQLVVSQVVRQIIRYNYVFMGVDDIVMLIVKVNQLCQCQLVNWLSKMIGGIVVLDILVVGVSGQNWFWFVECNDVYFF